MIKKLVVTTLLLLVTYELFIRSFDVSWTAGQNQWQANIIRANDFLYSDSLYSNVMVGSSISNRITSKIEKDSLPSDFYSLAFSGQSSFDGLLILQNLGYAPKCLFIESNIMTRNEDENFQEALFSPVMYPLKKHMRSLRDKYQPVEVVSRLLTGKRLNSGISLPNKNQKMVRDEKAYQISMKIQVRKSQQVVTEQLLNLQIEKMKKFVEHFQKNGSQVIFFEVPLDPAICGLPAQVQTREAVEKAFTPMNCKFIKIPDCIDYYTTDGTHLADISIYKYLNYFRKELIREKILAIDQQSE